MGMCDLDGFVYLPYFRVRIQGFGKPMIKKSTVSVS
jgi:hypothetical protein